MNDLTSRFDLGAVLHADRVGTYQTAHDWKTGREVTLRRIRVSRASASRRLERELQLLAEARHEVLPQVYDVLVFGEGRGEELVGVLEPLRGRSVSEKLSLRHQEVRAVVGGLLSALQLVHERGLIHRRIGSETLLLKEDAGGVWLPKLVGWGSHIELGARSSTAGDRQGDARPDLLELAPELFRGATGDAAADVYGAAALAFRLLFGRRVMEPAAGLAQLDAATLHALAHEPRAIPEHLAPPLRDWFRSCLAMEPEARPSAADARELLLRALGGARARRLSGVRCTTRATSPSELGVHPGCELGRYRVEHVLGRGGMGTVFQAYDPRLDRPVAIKLMHDLAPKASETLRLEAKALARVRSTNVVQVFELDFHRGAPFIVMELIRGSSLEARLCVEGPLEPERCADLLDELAIGLSDLHRLGLVHGDVKPANVLVDEDGRVVLTDFGLVRRSEALSSPDAPIVGTPAYMAPERLSGSMRAELGARVDVYALGVTLFEMLTGRLPFAGSLSDVVEGHLRGPVPRAGDFAPSVPRTVDPVLERALAKDPEARFATCSELAEAFREALTRASPPHDAPFRVVLLGRDSARRTRVARHIANAMEPLDLNHVVDARALAAVVARGAPQVVVVDLALPSSTLRRAALALARLDSVPLLLGLAPSGELGAEERGVVREGLALDHLLREPLDVARIVDLVGRARELGFERRRGA